MGSFSAGHWIVFGVLAWVVWKILKSRDADNGTAMFCTSCGHEGPTGQQTKGSIWIEIVLWVCFLVPGLIYSIWRHTTRAPVCKSCGATTLVPPASPVAVAQKKMLGTQ
jgi:predicted RNA-binding Zn-ribbon protein involved in translation (DUF1610 family)